MKERRGKRLENKKIAIGSDHGGFILKSKIIKHLEDMGFVVEDFGCDNADSCDYPDYAFPVSEAVAKGKFDRGILICGTGIGMCIAANKVNGIRAAVVTESTSAGLTKEHNNSNILCLGARITGEILALEAIDAWLFADFLDGNHKIRIDKIAEYEKKKGSECL